MLAFSPFFNLTLSFLLGFLSLLSWWYLLVSILHHQLNRIPTIPCHCLPILSTARQTMLRVTLNLILLTLYCLCSPTAFMLCTVVVIQCPLPPPPPWYHSLLPLTATATDELILLLLPRIWKTFGCMLNIE